MPGIGFGSGTNLSGGDALNMLYRAVELPTMSEARQLGSLHYDYNDGARWVRKICDDEAQAVANSAAPVMSILQTSPHLLPWPQASLVLNGDRRLLNAFEDSAPGHGHEVLCRQLVDKLISAGMRRFVLCGAGGHGGIGPIFIEMASDFGLEIVAYADHFAGLVDGRFCGVDAVAMQDVAAIDCTQVAIISPGYGAQIASDISRTFAGAGRSPVIVR